MRSMTTPIARAALAALALAIIPTVASAQLHGLTGRYYSYDGGYLEDMTFSDPGYQFEFSRIDEEIAFGWSQEHYAGNNGNGIGFDWEPLGQGAGAFGVHWTGHITIPEGQELFLGTEADDGSYLYINDALAIDNGGQHYPTFAWTDDALASGRYSIDIYLFCNDLTPPTDKSGIDLWWSPKPVIVEDSGWVPSSALDPVPEPASIVLLLTGLGASALSARRRRRG